VFQQRVEAVNYEDEDSRFQGCFAYGVTGSVYRGKGLTSLTLLITKHLRLNTILNKMVEGLYIIKRE
jgi:hypothetical protein